MSFVFCTLKTNRNRIGVVEYGHFMLATVNGHLDIILQLYLWCTNKQRSRIFFINDDSNYLFEYACRDGNLDIVQLMYSWMDFGDQRTNSTSHLYAGFREAAEYGHLEILRQIYDWCDETDREKMIRSSSRYDLYPYPPLPAYECFTDASRKGHLDIVRQIHAWCSEAERILMVKEVGFTVFQMVSTPCLDYKLEPKAAEQIYNWSDDEGFIKYGRNFKKNGQE